MPEPRYRILVIDDEADIRESLEALLTMENYAVDLAVNGGDGLAKFDAQSYDMVLVDLGPLDGAGLPDGDLARQIAGTIDAVVLVHNERITSEEQRIMFEDQLAAAGIAVLGIIDNFATE